MTRPIRRELLLDRPAGLADEIALVERLAAVLVLEMRLGVGKEGDRGDVELRRPLGLAHRLVDAEPVDARHRGDGNALVLCPRSGRAARSGRSSSGRSPTRAAAPIPPCGCGGGGGRCRGDAGLRQCGTACSWGRSSSPLIIRRLRALAKVGGSSSAAFRDGRLSAPSGTDRFRADLEDIGAMAALAPI